MPFRVVAAQISHETNVFSSVPTDFAAFQASGLTTGNAILTAARDTKSAFGGFMSGSAAEGFTLIPLLSVWATPSGLVTAGAFKSIAELLERGLRAAMEDAAVAGVLLALHGAMVSKEHRDADGELLALARRVVGASVPIVATLDLHANISHRMVNCADLLIGYHTYPHVDMAARAHDACLLLGRLMRREIRPAAHLQKPGMLPTSQRMTTDRDPMRSLMAAAEELERHPAVLDVTLAGGFPAADVPEAGFSVLVTTDNNADLARDLANDLAVKAWQRREDFLGGVSSWEEAAAALCALPAEPDTGPLVLVDIGDNPWTGGPGDSAELLRFLLAHHVKCAALASITDPEAVARCRAAGLNATLDLSVGGKTDSLHGDPLLVRGTVRTLSDGIYVNAGPMMAGLTVNLGPTVVLACAMPGSTAGSSVDVLITSRAETPIDLNVYRRHGIEPTQLRVVALKGKGHFRAAFEPIASEVILVEGPGITGSDLTRLPFRHTTRPIWPLDADAPGPVHDVRRSTAKGNVT